MIFLKPKYYVIFAAMILPIVSIAAIALEANLQTAYVDALKNNLEHQASVIHHEAELKRLPISKSDLLPNLTTQLNENYTKETLVAPDLPFVTPGEANYRGRSVAVQLRQVIFNKAMFSAYSKSKLYVVLAQLELEISKKNLKQKVLKAYIQVLNGKDNLAVATSSLDAALQRFNLIKEQQRLGLSIEADLLQTKALWLVTKSEHIASINNLKDSEEQLFSITGERYRALSDIDTSTLLPEEYLKENFQITNNLEYLKQEALVNLAKREVISQKGSYYPSVNLILSYNEALNEGSLSGPASETTSSRAVLQFEMPIYSGGKVKASVSQAKLLLQEQQKKLQQIGQSIRLENTKLLSDISALKEYLNALRLASSSEEKALEIKTKMYSEGLVDNSEVLSSQKNLSESKKKYFSAKRELITSYRALLISMGIEDVVAR